MKDSNTVFLFSIYFIGIVLWVLFFYLSQPDHLNIYFESPIKYHYGYDGDFNNFKNLFINFHFNELKYFDNYKEFQYLQIIKESLESKIIPFYVYGISELFPFKNDFFFAVPIWTMSPQLFILKYFNVYDFYFFNLILLYSVSFIGLFLIKQKYKLSHFSFLFLFLIFNFNGHIISYLSSYGQSQLGYFFLPYFFYFFFKITLEEEKKRYLNSIYLGITIWLILLQGSLHLFSQLIIFLILYLLFNLSLFKELIISIIISFLLSLNRLLPAFIVNLNSSNTRNVSGFSDLGVIVNSITELKSPFDYFSFEGWHEYNYYLSFNGLIILIIFAFFIYSFSNKIRLFELRAKNYLPIIIFIIFSFRNTYEIIPRFIPLFNLESLTARFFIIPLIFFTIVSAINIDRFFDYIDSNSLKFKAKFIYFTNIIILFFLLINHARIWRLPRIHYESKYLSKSTPEINLEIKSILDINGQLFIYSSIFCVIFLFILVIYIAKIKISSIKR